MTVDEVIAGYLQLRAHKEATVAKHKLELAPITEQMNKCMAYVQQQLQKDGLQSFKSQSGIAFLQRDTSVTSADWDATLAWILEAKDRHVFLEKRVSKSVVQDYIESTGEAPPGVRVVTSIDVHIRKS